MKVKEIICGLLVIFLIEGHCKTVSDEELQKFQELVLQMPEEERYNFLRDHVIRGYELSRQDVDLEELDYDSSLSLSVYQYFKKAQEDVEKKIENLLGNVKTRDQICFPVIGCIDSGDAAIRPQF